ncbi:MAG: sodium:solute symporter family transporter [Planctomycetota bacterium]|jgi:SSS family transporter
MSTLDWAIIAAFFVLVLAIGTWWSRKERTATDFYLASRRVPALAAAASVVATSLSVATFIGAPQESFDGNLTYLVTNIGTVLGIVVVAIWFIPAFYKSNVTTVYELLGSRYSPAAQRGASVMFLLGRTLASGVRLYLAGIPTSFVLFGDISNPHVVLSICIVALIACIYTMLGGIGAVIWTDTLQLLIVVGSAIACIFILLNHINMPLQDIASAVEQSRAPDGSTKLTLIDTRLDPQVTYSLWSSLIGFTLISVAIYGTDQDLTQRLLTCRSARQGQIASIVSQLIGMFVVGVFLVLGLLLYVWYSMNTAQESPDDSREVLLAFILDEIPHGLRGLMLAGILAAAMSSLDSALNAMSAVFTRDVMGIRDESKRAVKIARLGVIHVAAILTITACGFVFLQQYAGETLLNFALGVMTYAHSGLLAVFACALFTRRGNSTSVLSAFATGLLVAVLTQYVLLDETGTPHLSVGWRMTAATLGAFVVCVLGTPNVRANGVTATQE